MASIRVKLMGRAGIAAFTSKAEVVLPKAGNVGPRPEDLWPSLAALIPRLPANKSKLASQMPWVKSSENFFSTWRKIAPCMPKYAEFLSLHKAGRTNLGNGFLHDLKLTRNAQNGKVASQEVELALGEFYLHVALQLRPQEIEEAGSDNNALLKVAQKCAEEDFEPFVHDARELVSDYDASLHKALEETSPWYEVSDGLFWQANFDIAAPAAFLHFLTALGHGSGQRPSPADVARHVEIAWEGMSGNDPAFEPARRAADVVYAKWLEASSMPVKADVTKMLMEHGLLVTEDVYDINTLMPEIMNAAMQQGDTKQQSA